MIEFIQNIPDTLSKLQQNSRFDKMVLLVDSNTHEVLKQLSLTDIGHIPICVIETGEKNKNLDSAIKVWDFFSENQLSRQSLLVNFGGGIITDLGGFCASTFMRGISYVNIPTSLLAMVDASVGGKTGINFQHFKNQIGTFHEPEEIFICTELLKSLPTSELINGWAEIIKHGIINGGKLWQLCKLGIPDLVNGTIWNEILKLNIEIKHDIVLQDSKEKNIRKILNLGHSVGHAIESAYLTKSAEIGHGQAVAAGIIIESIISHHKQLMGQTELQEISDVIQAIYPKLNLQEFELAGLLINLQHDKKNSNGKILMALPSAIGKVLPAVEVTEAEFAEAIKVYAQA